MSANRYVLGLAVLVTVVMILGSLGLTGAAAGAPASGTAASPARTPNLSLPTASSTGATAASALLTAKASTSPAASSPTSLPTPSGRMSSALAELRALHVPLKYAFLPNLNVNPNPSLVNGHINPGYGSAPAPLGVAEYGLRNVSGTITPYTVSTPSVLGTYSPSFMSGLSQDISGPDEYGVQLNSVLSNVTLQGTTGYEFWTQNVVEYSTYSHQLFFVSNIWNFSSTSGTIEPNDFYQIGPNATVAAPEYYYGLGGPITITYPFTLNLYLNSTLLDGRDAVFFNFTLQNQTEFFAGSYDYAIFNSTVAGGPAALPPAYVATGSTYNAFGLPDDFEMVLGGPGGGSNFDVLAAGSYFALQFWNTSADAYSPVSSAYGYGSETGETAIGADVLWGATLITGLPEMSAYLSTGPSVLQPLWNYPDTVGTYGTYGTLYLDLAPSNGFVFIAPGSVFTSWSSTNWSLFEWAPYSWTNYYYYLPAGTYTVVAILANYDPSETTVTITAGAPTDSFVTLTYDPYQGVYTPLWAFNNFDLENISNYNGGAYVLFNQQDGPLGYAGQSDAQFPWFGAANDYLFPVFAGILLWNTSIEAEVFSPPSFEVNYPAPLFAELANGGLPTSNDLQMMFYNDFGVYLDHAASIGGWWYSGAYFGPAVSAYNVVFWNTSDSEVFENTFNTGGNALYLYGGTHNLVANNTFEETVPISADPYATVAGTYGSMGIFEADYGNATDVAAHLGISNDTWDCFLTSYCDLIFNNIFLTAYTADSPLFDPYYFYLAYPMCPAWFGLGTITCFFDDAWNVVPGVVDWSTNIIGGPELGGNYWWNYGSELNPYSEIPYYAYEFATFIEWGGDYLPLTPYALYQVSFVETGLPAGTGWDVGADVDGIYQYVDSITTMANLTVPGGTPSELAVEYTYFLESFDGAFAAPGGSVTVTNHSIVVDVVFQSAYTIQFTESGLPTGADWWVWVFNSTNDAFLGEAFSTGTTANFTGVLPATYLWEAGTDAAWRTPSPYEGTVDLHGNLEVAITYVPFYTLTVAETGLPTGTSWTLIVWNATSTDTSSTSTVNQSFDVLPGPYNWVAIASGYTATPNQGSVAVSGNDTLDVKFAVAATLTFTETGLPTGTAWTVSLVQGGITVNETSVGTSIVFAAVVGTYNYSVSSTGYTPSPASGTGTLPANGAVPVTFTAGAPKTGSLALTVTTAGATATVNGVAVTLPLNQAEAPGLYAIVVSESGYLTYYNNVSVTSGQTTHLSVTLTPTSSSTGTTSSSTGISTTAWVLIALLGLLAVVFLITTLLMARRGRSPPPLTSPPPMAGAAASPPPDGTPAWSEGPSPPPGAQ